MFNFFWSHNNVVEFQDPFTYTVNTDQHTLPLSSGYNYNFVVDWGDGTTSSITSWDDTDKSHTYQAVADYEIKIKGLCEYVYFYNDASQLISIDNWGNTGFISMEQSFEGASNLTSIPDTYDSNWCQYVTNMSNMFYGCSSLVNLTVDNWNTSNVTDMSYMFYNCTSIQDISNISSWNIQSIEAYSTNNSMYYMFFNCDNIIEATYDDVLFGWTNTPSTIPSNVRFDIAVAHTSNSQANYDTLVNTYNWDINENAT